MSATRVRDRAYGRAGECDDAALRKATVTPVSARTPIASDPAGVAQRQHEEGRPHAGGR
jgi:hypothetical protein